MRQIFEYHLGTIQNTAHSKLLIFDPHTVPGHEFIFDNSTFEQRLKYFQQKK